MHALDLTCNLSTAGGNLSLVALQLPLRWKVKHQIDGSLVVPYSPFLAWISKAHIKKFCSSVNSIKNICKCINKGGDTAVLDIYEEWTSNEEIKQFVMSSDISYNITA